MENKNQSDFIPTNNQLLATRKKVTILLLIITALKLVDLGSSIYLSNAVNMDAPSSIYFSLIIFLGFAYLIYIGYRWPLYLWAVGCVLSAFNFISNMQFWGMSDLLNLTLVLSLFFMIGFSAIILYLLLNKETKNYFSHYRSSRGK